MSAITNEDIYKGGHVFYFEPNDAETMGKDQDGQDVPLMAHLEDLCIAMTLTADIYPRKKKHIPKNGDRSDIVQRSISWISYVNGVSNETDTNHQIINAGVKMGDEKYLTTYYTEISADSYIENELVEGLGVTSVNISYESWYTPTITINFVDVHGSALWGREEAIHDSDGNITSDTLLGVFFQQPYPLFRLQVKGFLGKEVTYQLSVSSFNGKYNSQTGNFEATATFIGYSYSLLTDIPLKALAYVSEMDYVGRQYWESRRSSPEWAMINADGTKSEPIKLYKLIQNIESAIGTIKEQDAKNCDGTPSEETTVDTSVKSPEQENKKVTLREATIMNDGIKTQTYIDDIETALSTFVKSCKSVCNKAIEGSEVFNGVTQNQILLLFDTDTITLDWSIKNKYSQLELAIEQYNNSRKNDKFVNSIEKNNKKFADALSEPTKKSIENTKLFKVSNASGNSSVSINFSPISTNGEPTTVERLMPNSTSLYGNTVRQLQNYVLAKKKEPLPDNVGEYGYVISLGDMYSRIEKLRNKVQNAAKNIKAKKEAESANQSNSNETINDGEVATVKKRIVDIIGFEPTIGNFIKLVMCHLETFVEVMMTCGDRIYNDLNDRTPSNFGISIDNTDIPIGNRNGKGTTSDDNDAVIWPWPALYNPTQKENSETKGNGGKYEALGWTNDYPQKQGGVGWEEQNVILSALQAIQRFEQKGRNIGVGYTTEYASIPMSGSDILTQSPFINVGSLCKDLETLTPYLGLRIANLIGVGDNKCDASVAEAIGYMDALNMVKASGNVKNLQNAVTSKGTEQNFADEVIRYLTCNNNVSSRQTQTNNKYNNFEILNGKNFYTSNNSERHPMFVNVNNTYKYSYTYAVPISGDTPISVIPTQLYSLNGQTNPYSSTFTKIESGSDSKKYYMNPKVNDNGDYQNFIYTTNSQNVNSIYGNEKYTNGQLFSIVDSSNVVKSLVERYDSLVKGDFSVKGYGVKYDDRAKKVIERKYPNGLLNQKYCDIYPKSCALSPMYSKADEKYYNESLWNTESDSVTFNDSWTKTSTNGQMKYDSDKGIYMKYGDKEYFSNEVRVCDLPITTNGETKCSLFGTRLFYQQNDLTEKQNEAKAYLLLSSMMSGINVNCDKLKKNIFKNTSNGSMIDYLPPFYIYFIGALLWRRKEYEDNDTEPLNMDGFNNVSKDESFIRTQDGLFFVVSQNQGSPKRYGISDYYMEYSKIDISVRNKLINLFENFANGGQFKTILNNCELKDTNGNSITVASWKELTKNWSNSKQEEWTSDKWKGLFKNVFGNYSSITVPQGCGKVTLRMLINENNKAAEILKNVFGINGGFIVARATSNHVGNGNNEVSVTSEQMRGYLKGFKARIDDAAKNVASTNKMEEAIQMDDTDRDLAISFYYSLKHLWDTWLISAQRNQFTIENFFNKYFVFIDSFYVNTYNTIKLNCEYIMDAYNTENANLLSFITNVTSKERCMFFALPTFMDSNLMNNGSTKVNSYKEHSDLSYNKENLRHIFTPYTFNDMSEPKPNNIFVFVYTQPYSSNASEMTGKRFDSYMINDTNSWPGLLKVNVLGTNSEEEDNFLTGASSASPNNSLSDSQDELISSRHAYYMPCFGIAVNRGNNYIFKGINVSMDSPKITAVAAQTYSDILDKTGKDATKRIFFHGQDIFQIYQQYAYSCEVEMLGCTQIQPLMYFQLLNIPMWRGTYMIYKVSHTMQPGNMTTKFVGVKMSRYQAPYASGYYSVPKESANNGSSSSSASLSNSSSGYGSAPVGGEEMIRNIFGGKIFAVKNNTYEQYRFNKDKQKYYHHQGTDISCKEGTPLYAPWDGYVTKSENSDTAGNWMWFKDVSGKNMVIYMHGKELKVSADSNKLIKQGTLLMLAGNTGRSSGSHLHLELYINGRFNRGEELVKFGGVCQAVNPMTPYGYTNGSGSSDTTTYSSDTSSSTSGNSSKKSSKNKVTDGICIVADSWSEGLKDYFQYNSGKQGIHLDNIINDYLPTALKTKADRIVIYCGINDTDNMFHHSEWQNKFMKMAEMVVKAGKKCYICTYPKLIYPSGNNGCVTAQSITTLNTAISQSGFGGKCSVILVSDDVSYNNVDASKYHLTKKGYKKLAEFIHNYIKQHG